jgi:hypothetical protein
MILNTTKSEETVTGLRKAAMLLVVWVSRPAPTCSSSSPKKTSRRSAAKWPRSPPSPRTGRSRPERVPSHLHGGRLRRARRHGVRPQTADDAPLLRMLPSGSWTASPRRWAPTRPRSTLSRRPIPASSPSSSTTSTRKPSPWCSRTSTRRRPPPADLAARADARRRGAAHGQPGPDLPGNHPQDRRRDRPEAENA